MHQQLTVVKFRLEVDKVPVLNEMPCQVMHTTTFDLDTNIMPGHSGLGFLVYIGDLKLPGCINITEPKIAEIGSFP